MNDLVLIHNDFDYEQVGFWPLPYCSLPCVPGTTSGALTVSVCQGSDLIRSAQEEAGWANAVPLKDQDPDKED